MRRKPYTHQREHVSTIRQLWRKGIYTQGDLGEAFDACPSNIHRIVRHKTWRKERK